MRVVALIGKSGSGKSYKVISLSRALGIDYVIDDGLLIKENKVIAGKSAKRENTKISAVKRAIFLDYNYRNSIIEAINSLCPKSILIIGTSENMVEKISKALELGNIEEKIYIEDISSKEEIAIAKHERTIEGKHIIPVPTFEIKKDFSGYFLDSLKIFKNKSTAKKEVYEKTVVRPTFSYLGKYKISDEVIKDIVKYNISKVEGIIKTHRIYMENNMRGIFINIEISIIYGYDIISVVKSMQRKVAKEIEHMTSLNILGINVDVKTLRLKNDFKFIGMNKK